VIGNFYGEKQGPKIWNNQLDKLLRGLGFVCCPAHPCVYKLTVKENFICLVVLVDDGLMMSNCDQLYVIYQ